MYQLTFYLLYSVVITVSDVTELRNRSSTTRIPRNRKSSPWIPWLRIQYMAVAWQEASHDLMLAWEVLKLTSLVDRLWRHIQHMGYHQQETAQKYATPPMFCYNLILMCATAGHELKPPGSTTPIPLVASAFNKINGGNILAYAVGYDWSHGYKGNTPNQPNRIMLHAIKVGVSLAYWLGRLADGVAYCLFRRKKSSLGRKERSKRSLSFLPCITAICERSNGMANVVHLKQIADYQSQREEPRLSVFS